MNITTAVGIFVGAYLCYVVVRSLAKRSAVVSNYRREMYDLLTNEKYQVKGKFD
jgi:hypothetical protein